MTTAGDDIYLRGQAVKVLMEPVSAVVLLTLRWPERDAKVWEPIVIPVVASRVVQGSKAVGVAQNPTEPPRPPHPVAPLPG